MATLLNIESGRVATVATFYKVLEILGVGRFSEVYRAFDTHSQSDVALKLYVRSDSKSHELAKSEAGLLSRLRDLNSEYFPALRKSVKQRIDNQHHPLLVLELGAYPRRGWTEARHNRLEKRRIEIERERFCTIADIQHHGRAWVLPHPERASTEVCRDGEG